MTTTLLSFSGGLDSLASALLLQQTGYTVTLGHVEWIIEGTNWGQAQTQAAKDLAVELDLPFEILAKCWFPETSFAKYSWVPVCISTIMHHAGDPCVYPADQKLRYDSVAFGFDAIPFDDRDFGVKRKWIAGMQEYMYAGEVFFPTNGLYRHKGHYDRLIPKELWDMAVSCYLGPDGTIPCGDCPKCVAHPGVLT